ncbi:MAG: prenyltransferase [Methanomassiliicoccaceae archaeon]|jgi:1,4-dihydroxy-2-naphthoate octaprenyltransferase|nr:prenyltransferase [Euryarchaeota archaeon]HQD87774.1 prenyltransferase [Methanomassiliicoccaceae archaeon]
MDVRPEEMTLWQKVKEVLRIAYTLPFLLASVAGIAFALTVKQEWLMAVVIPLDVLVLALFVNFSNDYFDHKSGVDKLRFDRSNDPELEKALLELFDQKVFWSGNSLDRGIITESQGKVLMAVLVILAVLLSIPILLYGGWTVVVLGLIALALAFFYTAPPFNLGARGLGELDVFISFTMMAFFSYYVIVQEFSLTVLFVSLAIGLGAMIMRISDSVPGYDSHMAMGEKNLTVRVGLENVVRLEAVLVILVYVFVGLAGLTEPFLVILFLATPFAIKALRVQNIRDRLRFWRPIPMFLLQTVALELLTVVALILRTLTY